MDSAGIKLNINTFLVIVSLAVQGGIYFASLQPLPGKMDAVAEQLGALDRKVANVEWNQQQGQRDVTALSARVAASETDNAEQWKAIREVQATERNSMQREEFVEWKAELERGNGTILVPKLPKRN